MAENKKLPFMSIDENGMRAGKLGEEYAKWVLDILRNFVVVAFLFFIAEMSGKWYMWGLAIVGAIALYQFVFAYVNQAQFNLGPAREGGPTGVDILLRIFLILVASAITAALTLSSIAAFLAVIKEIAAVQTK
ncbi:hypothetical protein [Bradyrhizobium sp. 2S1]|uniref:hypothetical protein n=1 Tax=Bradyrhizobium sp. 2S1 TaxID=1404429 RepID=UPI00140C8B32|nr:hypothetical protein [Bradyrhizobium sp. 2S1]MCK7669189.1 hypothetical protein [Bradyrhizobium sp. 2S1]